MPDAHLAALTTIEHEHGRSLASTDSGFARFGELRWFDPLPA